MDLYKAAFILGAVICTVSTDSELTCALGEGKEYRGTIAVTWSGRTCQRWLDQWPHKHSITPENYPKGGLESNYCRNPNNGVRPWCYTTDPYTEWEFCIVPKCEDSPGAELTCTSGNGKAYRGTISETWSGKTCQRWSDQKPHEHSRTPQNYPRGDLESNYCRNAEGEVRPWCYTTDPNTRWEYCIVPRCGTLPGPELTCTSGNGKAYRGTIAVTWSGKTCQRWSDQRPHKPNFTPENSPNSVLESNYCRNPNNYEGPWCYTTDPDTRWEYCRVPTCETSHGPELTCTSGIGEAYRGAMAVTWSGKTCQRWSDQSPHSHKRTPQNYPSGDLESNYCRNPDGSDGPWCYTTDPNTRWEYCSVPKCGTTPEPARPVSSSQLSCLISDGTSYRGTVAKTWSGKTCQSWSAQAPHKHNFSPSNHPGKGLDSNFCRNPNGLFMPWCFTTDPETVTDYCRVPLCVNTTGPGECIHCKGKNYRGKISTTDNGFTCQRWDSQTPHKHDYTPSAHPEKHLEENYCRNPSGDSRLWCYTTDPSKRWDFCSVPHCTSEPSPIVPELTCATGDGSAYRGTIAVTESGKTCQSWSDQKPHRHNHTPCKYPCGGLENNYCRNPNNEKRPWCYTTDPDTLWEFCDVPSCGK